MKFGPFLKNFQKKRSSRKRRVEFCSQESLFPGGYNNTVKYYVRVMSSQCVSEELESLAGPEERKLLSRRLPNLLSPRGPRSKGKVARKGGVPFSHNTDGNCGIGEVSAGRISNELKRTRASLKSRKRQNKQKDESGDSEEIIPSRIRFCGQARRARDNSNTGSTERTKLDSATFLHYFMQRRLRRNQSIASFLKHLKAVLDDVAYCKLPFDEALSKECEELNFAVNEARIFLEIWSPKTSKILCFQRSGSEAIVKHEEYACIFQPGLLTEHRNHCSWMLISDQLELQEIGQDICSKEASQTIVHELHELREQMLKEAQALQAQIQQIMLTENQRRQQDEATIQGLQSSVQTLTTQNNQLHNYVNHLQYALATLVDDPEEEPEEDLMEYEAVAEGEILDN